MLSSLYYAAQLGRAQKQVARSEDLKSRNCLSQDAIECYTSGKNAETQRNTQCALCYQLPIPAHCAWHLKMDGPEFPQISLRKKRYSLKIISINGKLEYLMNFTKTDSQSRKAKMKEPIGMKIGVKTCSTLIHFKIIFHIFLTEILITKRLNFY